MTRQFGRGFRRLLRSSVLAVVMTGSALPALAESLGDTLVAAYRHSALLDQNRALLRAADEDVAGNMASLRPIVDWALQHSYNDRNGADRRRRRLA